MWRRALLLSAAGAVLLSAAAAVPRARAQLSGLVGAAGGGPPLRRDQPVFYQADSAQYERDIGLVTLTGHVEIWQGERILRADRVTYDRNTQVAAAQGHVVLLEPDGQVIFAEYAELTGSMRDGVMRNFAAQLAENGKLVANGGRRVDAKINELSRVVYSTCDVCRQHPERPPLWDLRARAAVQDVEHKRIEYRDAVLDIYGVPVFWLPYFTHADPSAKRASGFLIPTAGESSHLGGFFSLPYYWAIDDQQDLVLTPEVATKAGPVLDLTYRRRFNEGQLEANGSIGYDSSHLQGHIFTKGQFAIDDEWRWGFDVNRASSTTYLRDFKLLSAVPDVLNSQVYLEGFGQGAYARLDTRLYQGLTTSIQNQRLPYVLPRYQYSYTGEPDALGGRLSVDAGAFNVLRETGTNTQRGSLQLDWQRPFQGAAGDLWTARLHLDSAVYNANQLNQSPSFGRRGGGDTAQAMPSVSLAFRWPFLRDAGDWGSQLIEPRFQLVAAPNGAGYGVAQRPDGTRFLNTLVPNEDSLLPELTDTNLFALNRFPGIDRLEGGLRADVALHGAWYFPGGATLDGQIGQSYRQHRDTAFPVGSGLSDTASDVVGHISFSPNPWVDFTTQARFDHRNWHVRLADALASVGPDWLRINAGYLYSSYNPYFYYDNVPTGTYPQTPRNEVTLSVNSLIGPVRISGYARRDVRTRKMIGAGASGSYENECFVFSANVFRRYTSLQNDSGGTTVLFQVTLKTVGTFGFHAL